ncbi:hypothetical protein PoB_007466100 [Plakobranchus ocellatus]|uniref:Uncharacterized protein n=1 Tax=Plakobranchus ocellatus TaxID=259542 RepID=A0AAV4DVK2_9GAST|nr:hypothetical protein PoB_007466100 [Plakobranchus ocellatus]
MILINIIINPLVLMNVVAPVKVCQLASSTSLLFSSSLRALTFVMANQGQSVHNKVISDFQAFFQARTLVVGLESATDGPLQISGLIRNRRPQNYGAVFQHN